MLQMLGDQGLLEGFRSGEADALNRVYQTYVVDVRRAAYRGFGCGVNGGIVRVHSPDQLADVVQEVFVRAFSLKVRISYDGRREFRGLLLTITRNVIADLFRERSKEVALIDSIAGELEEPEPIDEWLDPELARAAEVYVADLLPALKALYQARFVEGLSQEEAARLLGSTRQRVRTLEQQLLDGIKYRIENHEKRGTVSSLKHSYLGRCQPNNATIRRHD